MYANPPLSKMKNPGGSVAGSIKLVKTAIVYSLCIELALVLIYQAWKSVGLDPGFGTISSFRKFSKSGFNHLSVCICFHCSPMVPYLKQFLIHCNHPVHSWSLSTFL